MEKILISNGIPQNIGYKADDFKSKDHNKLEIQ